jgi:hypothetical protein
VRLYFNSERDLFQAVVARPVERRLLPRKPHKDHRLSHSKDELEPSVASA